MANRFVASFLKRCTPLDLHKSDSLEKNSDPSLPFCSESVIQTIAATLSSDKIFDISFFFWYSSLLRCVSSRLATPRSKGRIIFAVLFSSSFLENSLSGLARTLAIKTSCSFSPVYWKQRKFVFDTIPCWAVVCFVLLSETTRHCQTLKRFLEMG